MTITTKAVNNAAVIESMLVRAEALAEEAILNVEAAVAMVTEDEKMGRCRSYQEADKLRSWMHSGRAYKLEMAADALLRAAR